MLKLTMAVFFLLGTLQIEAATNYNLDLLLNNQSDLKMKAGLKTKLNLSMTHVDSETPTTDFDPLYGKDMHLIIIKDDLSEFVRVHPHYIKDSSSFQIHLNTAPKDPDNFMARRAVRTPGHYLLYATAKPKGDPSLALASSDIESLNHDRALLAPRCHPAFDPIPVVFLDQSGRLVSEGENAHYRVDWKMKSTPLCEDHQVSFEIKIWSRALDGSFSEEPTIENWLEAAAHAFIVSFEGQRADEKFFSHLTAPQVNTRNSVVFALEDETDSFVSGTYRMWIQLKIKSKIFTIPFDFDYQYSGQASRCSCESND